MILIFWHALSVSWLHKAANTAHPLNDGQMLAHHLRRRPNIDPILGRYIMFAKAQQISQQTRDGVPVLDQRWDSSLLITRLRGGGKLVNKADGAICPMTIRVVITRPVSPGNQSRSPRYGSIM